MVTFLLIGLAGASFAADLQAPALWQERYFFDALLSARDRIARSESDPQMIPVLKAIASQAAQQSANLTQIDSYVKQQKDNLRYAFDQADPTPSLQTIGSNLETLAAGGDQVRSNLYFLTARCRLAASQALPDPQMYQASLQILGQIQQIQMKLNDLYLNASGAYQLVMDNGWATSKNSRHQAENLLKSVVRIQDSVFSVCNSAYDLAMRSR